MATTPARQRWIDRLASWPVLLGLAFGVRAAAALAVQWIVDQKKVLCVFPDTYAYWRLAEAIRAGGPYRLSEGGPPHYALRTPGYPLFLSACQATFGTEDRLAIRLVQAGLGVLAVWMTGRLIARVRPAEAVGSGWSAPKIAAGIAAVDPYVAVLAVLLLSEALFVPLMLATLCGVATLWPEADSIEAARRPWLALGTGLAAGAAILSRPSWALFVPALLLTWVVAAGRGHRGKAARGAMLVALGATIVMAPWWVRNARVFGRFVPTALWVGPSLYDGLNPKATGASDMSFLDEPDIRPLDELAMESTLRERAWSFARAHPGRALELAAIKSWRFWSPWPHAGEVRLPGLAVVGALATLPVYALILAGAWDRRRDPRALVLLAGPLLYFWALHAVFVGSIRYRIPGALPAMGLAALGARSLLGGRRKAADR